jgi:hypothetical protein
MENSRWLWRCALSDNVKVEREFIAAETGNREFRKVPRLYFRFME